MKLQDHFYAFANFNSDSCSLFLCALSAIRRFHCAETTEFPARGTPATEFDFHHGNTETRRRIRSNEQFCWNQK
jgi:hypothetical protein